MQFPTASQFLSASDLEAGAVTDTSADDGVRSGLYQSVFKRVIDVSLVLLAAPVVVPVVGVFAFMVSRDGASPFYWDRRVGLGGKKFRMMKLRTMVPRANIKLRKYLEENPAAAAEWERNQKLAEDPRITPLGQLLRKTSIDELPQLWNVLRGDMSIVGPRPMMPKQVKLYPGEDYFELRPGLTGPWQVSDRHTSAFSKRAEFDADYRREMSLATDVKLIARTVTVVLRGTGC
ncbi:sugar transferase [Acidimangrovimonas sediminis]|uniref:sugar transferase n=1 Tax=Acidimangrovimonas sediminis TaxID=2056283 RepID=UPI000C807A90|nr:sugar transferase [Acidimangrovimonas sediminis]